MAVLKTAKIALKYQNMNSCESSSWEVCLTVIHPFRHMLLNYGDN